MAFIIDAHLFNPTILRAFTAATRTLTSEELGQLRGELTGDPEQVGYRAEAGELKSAQDLAALLNTSGRGQALLGNCLLEAADVMLAAQG